MITPFHNFVVVEDIKEKIETSIILPENADTRPSSIVKVLAIGDKMTTPTKVGDQVFIQAYGFDEIEVDGKKVKIGKDENIIGRV